MCREYRPANFANVSEKQSCAETERGSSNSSMKSMAKAVGFVNGKFTPGKHKVEGRRLRQKINKLKIMENRVSDHVRNFVMEPENSAVEMLRLGDELDIEDINTKMDVFFIVSGALEFTMREDPLDHARKQYFANESVHSSFNDPQSLITSDQQPVVLGPTMKDFNNHEVEGFISKLTDKSGNETSNIKI